MATVQRVICYEPQPDSWFRTVNTVRFDRTDDARECREMLIRGNDVGWMDYIPPPTTGVTQGPHGRNTPVSTLPIPQVHYEMVRRYRDQNPLNLFNEEQKTAILMDPFNLKGTNSFPAQMAPEFGTTYNLMRSGIAYERAGQQVVVLGPRMQEAFMHTSLKEVSTAHIRFPHPCFYLATPGSTLRIWGGSQTGWHNIAGAYVMDDPCEPGVISILIWGPANERSIAPTDDATFWFSIKVGHGTEDVDAIADARIGLNELRDGALRNVERETAIVRQLDLDGRVSSVLSDHYNDISDVGAAEGIDQSVIKEVKANVQAFLRVVVNTLLYVNSASCETRDATPPEGERKALTDALSRKKHKKGKDARKLQNKLDSLPRYRVTWIGPTIESAAHSPTEGEGGSRTVRGHVRRGHWHTFRVGPRKTETGEKIDLKDQGTAIRWIAPVWVEGGSPEDKPRIYGVREPPAQ